MKREKVVRLLKEHWNDMQAFSVRSLAVFGSVARDEARSDSDVDILVEFDGVATFDRYMGLKCYLEDLLATRVDLTTLRALRPRLRPAVKREAIHVA